MPPAQINKGGRGQAVVLDYVISLRRRGFDDDLIRSQLKAEGKTASRIWQLLRDLHRREAAGSVEGPQVEDLMDASVQELEGVPKLNTHHTKMF